MSLNKGLNKVMVIGWLEDEPEVRHTPNGRAVASFSVSTTRSWTSTEGEKHEEKEWFNVVAWGALAEMIRDRLTKGQQIYVEGRLQTRGWEDSLGRKHFRTEVVAQEIIVLSE
jgi:single-strand DNA-binding protein